jgi:hypothetical protein
MRKNSAGAGEMPDEDAKMQVQNQPAEMNEGPAVAAEPQEGEGQQEKGKQPEFRLVQPEYDTRESKTIFKDVGAVWKNVSQKTGKEFYTLKIGKMRLLMFPNQKLEQ